MVVNGEPQYQLVLKVRAASRAALLAVVPACTPPNSDPLVLRWRAQAAPSRTKARVREHAGGLHGRGADPAAHGAAGPTLWCRRASTATSLARDSTRWSRSGWQRSSMITWVRTVPGAVPAALGTP